MIGCINIKRIEFFFLYFFRMIFIRIYYIGVIFVNNGFTVGVGYHKRIFIEFPDQIICAVFYLKIDLTSEKRHYLIKINFFVVG